MGRRKGTGSAYLRADGHWEGEIQLGRDEFGKLIRKYVTGASQAEVFDKLARIKEEYLRQSGSLVEPPSASLTLRRFVTDYWRPSVEGQITPNTLDHYLMDYGYVDRHIGCLPLGKVTTGEILRVMSLMQMEGLTEWQRYKGLKILKRILLLAVQMDFLAKSPAAMLKLPRVRKREMVPMGPDEVKRFLEANRGDRYYPLYMLALDSGARQGELFALEWSDWNPERAEVSITKSVENRKGQVRVKEPKTRAGKRTVIVSQKTAAALQAHWGAQPPDCKLIFPNMEGTGWIRNGNFNRYWWRPALRRAGLSGFRFHDLRHTCATLLLLAGDNPNSIAARLGHSSPEMIWRVYGHVLPQMRQESGQKMNQFL